eukprot:TRINITY_DN4271_c0_g1_i1.p1 TRINITY_DN4271_c0_g1~~TRINITY_DN4271_c0_g1_i1.p1  ORF type:complete len:180 (-),score=2.94 TRINITY_DN4271_c0_g1_i1:514-1053(-)
MGFPSLQKGSPVSAAMLSLCLLFPLVVRSAMAQDVSAMAPSSESTWLPVSLLTGDTNATTSASTRTGNEVQCAINCGALLNWSQCKKDCETCQDSATVCPYFISESISGNYTGYNCTSGDCEGYFIGQGIGWSVGLVTWAFFAVIGLICCVAIRRSRSQKMLLRHGITPGYGPYKGTNV